MPGSSSPPPVRTELDDLRQAVADAGLYTFRWEIGAGSVQWSPGVEALFGLSPGGFDGRFETFVDLLHDEDREGVMAGIDRALRGETDAYSVEHRVYAPGATPRWVTCHVTVVRDDAGKATRMLGLISDVTARRARDVAMRASEERYRTLFVQAGEGIFLVDASYRITDANESACRMLGYSRDHLLTLHAGAVLEPADLEVAPLRFASIPPGGVILSERRFLRKDRTAFPGEVSTRALADGSFQCVVRDVTERKQLEAELFLSDRMTSLGRLTSGVAHELNNPLAYVMLNLELTARKLRELSGRAPPETLELLTRAIADARDGADRMRRIVRMMSTFGRGDEEETGPVDLNAVLDSAAEIAAMQLRHRARLVRQYDCALPARGNAFRLGQVFVNLLVNAGDAVREGDPKNEVRVRTYASGDQVVAEVSDNGVGIAPELLGRIFDPFFTTKPVGQGTGLGLSVCHSIVTSFGGSIVCESALGVGTTFRVTLPGAPIAERSAPRSERRDPGARGRVLVVDDDPRVADAIARALEGHERVVAAGGREAIERCRGEPFDCIVCDVMMPDVTGLDVWAALEREGRGLHKRVVFVTGGAVTAEARARLAATPNRVLEKPLDASVLCAAVADVVAAAKG